MSDLPNPPDAPAPNDPTDLLEIVQPKQRKRGTDDPSVSVELSAKVLLPLVVLLLLLVSFLMVQVGSLSDGADRATAKAQDAIDATEQNRENGAKNRAAVCSLNIAVLGQAGTTEVCFEKEVLEFYNPDEVPPVASPEGQEYNTKLLCSIIYPDDPTARVKCAEEAG